MTLFFVVVFRGFHLAVIHNQPDLLDKLLYIMSKDQALKSVIDEQNCLFQVSRQYRQSLAKGVGGKKVPTKGISYKYGHLEEW